MNTLAIDGGKPTCTNSWASWPQFDDTERRLLAEVSNRVVGGSARR
jgi:hypothetical protein